MQDYGETMLEVFVYETMQFLEQLETSMLSGEKTRSFSDSAINEIFRVMHTIKSSAAMMMFDNMSHLAHTVEDLFHCLREDKPTNVDVSKLSDLVFDCIDFFKVEIAKVKNGHRADGSVKHLVESTRILLKSLQQSNPGMKTVLPKKRAEEQVGAQNQQYYIAPIRAASEIIQNFFKAVLYFEEGCQMEDVRAFGVVHKLKDDATELYYLPEDIVENDDAAQIIQRDGFVIYLATEMKSEELHELLQRTVGLDRIELLQLENDAELRQFRLRTEEMRQIVEDCLSDSAETQKLATEAKLTGSVSTQQSFISVSVPKLDTLMDLVGEMVIAEAMVIQNPDLQGLELDNFDKAAMQLNKITSEIQDVVMSVRMVPLSTTFRRMQRVVRDMGKKLDKQIDLKIIGEDTEVDKNIIEHISDPLMHLVRNAADHGIESSAERLSRGKPGAGTITLEAKNLGSDVIISVKDDGKGLNREQVLKKASERGLLEGTGENLSEREIFNLILLPGFSTKENVSQFSGRGVGMNVVTEGIDAIGGSVSVSSDFGEGTAISLKIPLTLAIIDGMNLKVGNSRYTMPTISIKESFRPRDKDIIIDPDGNEMIVVRGQSHSIVRLHRLFNVRTEVTEFTEGILIMIEQDEKSICVFADELVGQQQVVVKSLPEYVRNFKKIKGLAGCTLLGDGSISLILEPAGLVDL